MIYKLYAVKDELSNTFLQPALIRSDNEAKRVFKTQIKHTDIWNDNPEDFSLYCVGSFDEDTGTITAELTKITGGRAVKE